MNTKLISNITKEIQNGNFEKAINLTINLSDRIEKKSEISGFSSVLQAFRNFYRDIDKQERYYPALNKSELRAAMNKILLAIIELIRLIDGKEIEKNYIIECISRAEKIREAIEKLLEITRGTPWYNEALLISFQFQELIKQI